MSDLDYFSISTLFALLIFILTGAVTGTIGGNFEGPTRDRLVYVTTCLIGQQVEVQLKNGSVYSGIFHATDADKDFGICCLFSFYICFVDIEDHFFSFAA